MKTSGKAKHRVQKTVAAEPKKQQHARKTDRRQSTWVEGRQAAIEGAYYQMKHGKSLREACAAIIANPKYLSGSLCNMAKLRFRGDVAMLAQEIAAETAELRKEEVA